MSTPDYVIRIDPKREEIELYGIRYALACFEVLGLGKPGDALEIVERKDGVLVLQKLHVKTSVAPTERPSFDANGSPV